MFLAKASHGLVDRIVDDFVDQVVQASERDVADIHCRSLSDMLHVRQVLQVLGCIIAVCSAIYLPSGFSGSSCLVSPGASLGLFTLSGSSSSVSTSVVTHRILKIFWLITWTVNHPQEGSFVESSVITVLLIYLPVVLLLVVRIW